MFVALMVSFAAVMSVAALGVALSTTFGSRAIANRMASLSLLVAQQGEKIEKSAGTSLRVEVDGLAAGLDSLSKRNRQEFGKLWARVRPFEELPVQPPTSEVADERFSAMLALQNATPAKQQ